MIIYNYLFLKLYTLFMYIKLPLNYIKGNVRAQCKKDHQTLSTMKQNTNNFLGWVDLIGPHICPMVRSEPGPSFSFCFRVCVSVFQLLPLLSTHFKTFKIFLVLLESPLIQIEVDRK